MTETSPMRGACHCQAVKFEVTLKGEMASARRCNCSICRMRGAVALTAGVGDLRVVDGQEHLAEYRFNSGVARHWFCSRCGIYTHHQRRSNPDEFGVNAACLEGVSPFDFREVPVTDGVHHPSDGNPSRTVGVLRFEPRD